MLRLLCGSATSIYPSLFRSLSASRIPTITTTSATPIPVHLPPRLRPFSHSLRYAKGNRTATLPSQKRLSTQSHTHKKAQKDRGASKKKKADLRAVLCARREASQQVRREREEKVGEKKGEKPALGAAEKKRVKKELLKEKKAKKMEEKRLAKEVKEVERFAKRVRRKSKSPGKGDGTRRKDGGAGSRTRSNNDRLKDDRAGGRGGEARVSSPVSIGGRKRARSREVSRIRGRGEKRRVEDEDGYVRRRKHGSDFGSPVPRGEPPFQNISWKRGQKNKAGGWNTQNIVSDDEIFFAGNVQWKSPEEDELRREKAPPGKREREKMRLRHSRERSASMTRRAWTSSLEMAASPDRKVDLKERLRAVRLPPELIQRERDGRSASPQKDGSWSNSISSWGGEGGSRGGSFTQRRGIHTPASSSHGERSWREGWERRDDYRRGYRSDNMGGYRGGREDYRRGRQGCREDCRQEQEVRKGQDEEGGGYSHSSSCFSGGHRYRPPPSAPAYQSYTHSKQQEPIPETYDYVTKSHENQHVSQESYYQREVEPRQRRRDTYSRSRSPMADPQQGQHTSRRQYQNEWYPGGRSSPSPPPPAPAEIIPTAPHTEPASRPRCQKEWYSERGNPACEAYEPRSKFPYQHIQLQDHHSHQPLPFHEPFRSLHHRHQPLPPAHRRSSPDPLALPIPVPTPEYLHCASLLPTPLPPNSPPNPILIILDLNGTLLHRSKGSKATNSSKRPHPRPYLAQFLNYLFAHFSVMVWSSAQPANVASMVAAAFTSEQRERLVAVWGRDTLGLSRAQMFANVVVYKKLEKVWKSVGLSKGGKGGGGVWSQANTVLVDDSAIKASAQPFNVVEISTWEGGQDGARDKGLLEVAEYLEEVRRGGWGDVSAWMRVRPYRKGEWGEKVGSWFWGEGGGPVEESEKVGEGMKVVEGIGVVEGVGLVGESKNKRKRMNKKAKAKARKQEERARAEMSECAGEVENELIEVSVPN